MITSLKITNLKGFEDYVVGFSRLNLLVGGNNSGKTTIFHALQLFFWCVDQTADLGSSYVTFKKTQVPELGGIPYFIARDLFYKQRTRVRNAPTRINLAITADGVPDLSFKVYPAFSRNLMVDGANTRIAAREYQTLRNLKPVYVPGTIGITVREEMYRDFGGTAKSGASEFGVSTETAAGLGQIRRNDNPIIQPARPRCAI